MNAPDLDKIRETLRGSERCPEGLLTAEDWLRRARAYGLLSEWGNAIIAYENAYRLAWVERAKSR